MGDKEVEGREDWTGLGGGAFEWGVARTRSRIDREKSNRQSEQVSGGVYIAAQLWQFSLGEGLSTQMCRVFMYESTLSSGVSKLKMGSRVP